MFVAHPCNLCLYWAVYVQGTQNCTCGSRCDSLFLLHTPCLPLRSGLRLCLRTCLSFCDWFFGIISIMHFLKSFDIRYPAVMIIVRAA